MDEVNAAREAFWIEVLGRHREVVARQRVAGTAVAIGRAYDNDVVLDDPHVAAHHLRIARAPDGTWTAEDLGSLNGLYADGEAKRRERIAVDASTTLRIGHTGLRLRSAAEAVAAELPLRRSAHRWPAALVCIALVFALGLLELWLAETGEPKLIRYLTPLLALAAVVAVWTAAWAVISRVFSGHAQFGRHLLIVGVGLLAYTLIEQIGELGAFALSWPAPARFQYVAAWLLFAAICFAHLRALGPARLPAKAIAVGALAALGITMQSLKLSEWRSTYGQPIILQRLEPPSIRLVGTQNADAFFAGSAALKARLDRARSEEPAAADEDDGEE